MRRRRPGPGDDRRTAELTTIPPGSASPAGVRDSVERAFPADGPASDADHDGLGVRGQCVPDGRSLDLLGRAGVGARFPTAAGDPVLAGSPILYRSSSSPTRCRCSTASGTCSAPRLAAVADRRRDRGRVRLRRRALDPSTRRSPAAAAAPSRSSATRVKASIRLAGCNPVSPASRSTEHRREHRRRPRGRRPSTASLAPAAGDRRRDRARPPRPRNSRSSSFSGPGSGGPGCASASAAPADRGPAP